MAVYLFQRLPQELVDQILADLDGGVQALLGLRLVSKRFKQTITDDLLMRATHHTDIIQTFDRDIIRRWLWWSYRHETDETVNNLATQAQAFVLRHGHTLEVVLEAMFELLSVELVQQQLQLQRALNPQHFFGRRPRRPLHWWHDREPDNPEYTMLTVACALGDGKAIGHYVWKTHPWSQPLLGHPVQAIVRRGHEHLLYLIDRTVFKRNWSLLDDAVVGHPSILPRLLKMDLPDTSSPEPQWWTGSMPGDAMMRSYRLNIAVDFPRPVPLRTLQLCLLEACIGGHDKAFRLLELYPSLDVNFRGTRDRRRLWIRSLHGERSPLAEAAHKGNVKLLRALLKHGADTNYDLRYHESPLTYAVESKSQACIDELFDLALPAYQEWGHVVAVAVSHGDMTLAQRLLDHGFCPDPLSASNGPEYEYAKMRKHGLDVSKGREIARRLADQRHADDPDMWPRRAESVEAVADERCL